MYRRADAPQTAHVDLLAVCTRTPRAVVCGESALALHELIDDIPAAVHIAVPRGARRPTFSYPPTVVAQYAPTTFTLGVERFDAAPGETIPVYNAARSVVDAMRHRSRISETLALSALGRNLRRDGDLYRLFTLNDLDGQELTTALTATAAHRGIPLKPLSSTITDLGERRQAYDTAWRRRQGPVAPGYPERFTDVIRQVTAFADTFLDGDAAIRTWNLATLTWA